MTTDVQTAAAVAETEMDADWITPAFGSSFSSAAAVAGVVMVVADVVAAVDAAVATTAASSHLSKCSVDFL